MIAPEISIIPLAATFTAEPLMAAFAGSSFTLELPLIRLISLGPDDVIDPSLFRLIFAEPPALRMSSSAAASSILPPASVIVPEPFLIVIFVAVLSVASPSFSSRIASSPW